jgi:hypothetical protein
MNTQALKLQEQVNTNFYNREGYTDHSYLLKLPVKKLCGLKVECHLNFNKRYHADLIIDSDKVYTMDRDGNIESKRLYINSLLWKGEDKPFEEEDYKIILEKLSEIMKKIKFNKYTGLYETEKSNELSQDDWCSILGCEDHIEYIFDKCCICHDMTKTTTENCCDKSLCYECWDKLPVIKCEECSSDDPDCCCECMVTCGTPKCPLCRCSLVNGIGFDF